MAGLGLEGARVPEFEQFTGFSNQFADEISKVHEFSFGPESDALGVCILGRGTDFGKRFLRFAESVPFFARWYQEFKSCFTEFSDLDFGFKVSWRSGRISDLTLYLRSSGKWKAIPWAHQWTDLSPVRIANLLSQPHPFSYAVRASTVAGDLEHGLYIDIHRRSHMVRQKLPELLRELRWSVRMQEIIAEDMKKLSEKGFKGCVGTDPKAKILKLDYTGVGLGKILRFLEEKGTPPERTTELLQIAKDLKQPQPNYFALKYDAAGFVSWKVYFAIVGYGKS